MLYPKISPCVIGIILNGDEILLARNKLFPEGMFSAIAGFVEASETLEQTFEREIHEEVGLKVKNIKYFGSQPWPFPASLMMGCTGEAQNRSLKVDKDELEDAIWVSREQVFRALNGLDKSIFMARRGAIARHLIEKWVAGLI